MTELNPEIKTVEPFDIVGLPLRVDAGKHHEIGALWGQLHGRKGELPDADTAYGYCWCDKSRAEAEGAADPDADYAFHYVAALPVEGEIDVPEGMERFTIGGGRYLVFTHRGGMDTYPQTLAAIHGEYLPASEYEHDTRGDFELYDERWSEDPETNEFDVYVPIK